MKKLPYQVEHSMVKDGRGVIDIVLGNQVIVRVGNDTDHGVSLKSGTKLAMTMAAERLRELADRLEKDSKDV